MENKATAETRRFLSLITDPRTRAFIDLRKLTQSSQYRGTVEMATDHALRHGDFNFLNSILALLDGTPYASELIGSLRPRLIFVLTATKPRKLKKATPELVAHMAKKAASLPVLPQKIATHSVPKKRIAGFKKGIDLMDTRLRLPGSFGSGKRR